MESKVSVKDSKEALIFRFEGDLDNVACIKYKSTIAEIITQKLKKIVVFDLNHVSFIDSSGIGLILNRFKQVSQYQGKFVICGVNSQIKKTICISGIAGSLNVYEDIYENIKDCVVNAI